MFVNHSLICDSKPLRHEHLAKPLLRRGTGIAHFFILALSFRFTNLYLAFPIAHNRFSRYFLIKNPILFWIRYGDCYDLYRKTGFNQILLKRVTRFERATFTLAR